MGWLATLLVVEMLCGVHAEMGGSGSHDGFLNSFTARYRYPVYIAKRESGEQGISEEDSNEREVLAPYEDSTKRSPQDYDWSALSRMMDSGKKRMAMPLSELTPNIPSYIRLMDAGKRSPMNTLYDLPAAHRLFQVGKKRNYQSVDLDALERMLQAGKRSYNGWDLGSVNKMMEVGKKSYGGMDLNAVDRLMQAGKRGYEGLDLSAIDRLIQAGKRSYHGMDLNSINRLMQAGKRNYNGLDLDSINRLVQAGKRNYEQSSMEKPLQVGKRSYETRVSADEENEQDHDIPLDIAFLEKLYASPERRSNMLVRNIRPSLYDIKDMSSILEAGKKRNPEDTRTKRRVTDDSIEVAESEENHTKDDGQEKELSNDDSHDRTKRSVQWEDVFGIDKKKRDVDWSTVFGIDRKKRSSSWSDVFGIDRKKRSWDDYFGYDKRNNELQEELFDDWLAKQYMDNFNNFVLTKVDDDEEGYGKTALAPSQGYGRL